MRRPGPDSQHPAILESSSIATIAYSTEARTLDLEFVHGTRYRFFEVAKDLVEAFIVAPSKGRFFNAQVRGHYRYERI